MSAQQNIDQAKSEKLCQPADGAGFRALRRVPLENPCNVLYELQARAK